MNFLSSSHTLLLTLVVHKQNFLEQQPLSHMSFANQLIFKLCFSWLLTSMQESRGKVVFRQIKKMEKKGKGTGVTDTALLSTVAILGTTTKHRLWSQPVMQH